MADVTEYSQQNVGLSVSISMSTSFCCEIYAVEFDDFILEGHKLAELNVYVARVSQLSSQNIFPADLS
jgi:hypothetical protein